MPAPVVTLTEETPFVAPGDTVTLTVTVRSTGRVVEEFTVHPVGLPAEWVRVEPERLPLLPGTSGEVLVHVTPPREAGLSPGFRPYGMRVVGALAPDDSVVEEGELEIGAFREVVADLQPRLTRARGRRSARSEVLVDNRGNGPAEVTLAIEDPTGLVVVDLERTSLTCAADTAVPVAVRTRGRQPMWRGTAQLRTYEVVVTPAQDDAPALRLPATFLHEPLVPAAALKAAKLAVPVLAALALAWFAVVKPTVQDTAEAAAQTTAEQTALTAAQQAVAPVAEQATDQIADLAAKVGTSPPPPIVVPSVTARPTSPATAAPTPAATAVDVPYLARLQATAQQQQPFVDAAARQTLSLTDLVLDNPAGDTGAAVLRRGDTVLISTRLESFRNLDYHFVSPIVVGPGERLTLDITCQNPPGGAVCTGGLLLNGTQRTTPA